MGYSYLILGDVKTSQDWKVKFKNKYFDMKEYDLLCTFGRI